MSGILTCSGCICSTCLGGWQHEHPCAYGGRCWDDHRAAIDPYDAAHPSEPPRDSWSNWQDDQAHWCRGGEFYPIGGCKHYVAYDPQKTIVRHCLLFNVTIYQDGYIGCSGLVDGGRGCQYCYERWGDIMASDIGMEFLDD